MWSLLGDYATHDSDTRKSLCDNIAVKWQCMASKVDGMQFADGYRDIVKNTFSLVNDIVVQRCLPGKC